MDYVSYIIGAVGVWASLKYGQIMVADHMVNHPFMTTRFQAKMNQLKTY
jgi:hypothetical protein